jgi:hypothetical protein
MTNSLLPSFLASERLFTHSHMSLFPSSVGQVGCCVWPKDMSCWPLRVICWSLPACMCGHGCALIRLITWSPITPPRTPGTYQYTIPRHPVLSFSIFTSFLCFIGWWFGVGSLGGGSLCCTCARFVVVRLTTPPDVDTWPEQWALMPNTRRPYSAELPCVFVSSDPDVEEVWCASLATRAATPGAGFQEMDGQRVGVPLEEEYTSPTPSK